MLRKILLALLPFVLFFPFTTKTVLASEKSEGPVNLADEVYADLALRHALDHVSVYYFDDNIENTISINSDKNWDPASTIKLYVAMYAFDQVATGKISLDQIITVADINVAPSVSVDNGYPPLTAGQQISVYELLDRMITQSNNTSYNTLLDLLDRREISKYVHDLGLVNSSIGAKLNLNDAQEAVEMTNPGFGQNVTTAGDFARAFILINGKRIPGSPSLFEMLSRQKLNDLIPAYLPKNIVVAHKTGELDPFYHDGGIIVDPERTYILSIFTDNGDPSLVAHISQLVYTQDSSLIGAETSRQTIGEGPLPPIDPLVAEANGQRVLAATTQNQNLTLPPITASDIGIKPADLTSVLTSKQLPPVIIPTDSPLHFLVDLSSQINRLNPIVGLRLNAEASGLKLRLAETDNLLARGSPALANSVLNKIDESLNSIAEDKSLAGNTSAQAIINQVSETRFEILKKELADLKGSERTAIIKEIARQARNASNSVVPNIPDAIQKESLAQAPLVGKVTASTSNSITVETPNGSQITVETDPQVKTRDSSGDSTTVKNVKEIANGTEVAVAGLTQKNRKAAFIITNLPVDSATQTPVSVIKVDIKNNVLVVSKNGIPTQVDLTKNTIVKGSDDSASINDINPGDVLVVHGSPVSGNPQQQNTNTNTALSGNQGQNSSPAPATGVVNTGKSVSPQNQIQGPAIIKGKTIEIVGNPAPKAPEKKQEKPAPAPETVPQKPPSKEDKKK